MSIMSLLKSSFLYLKDNYLKLIAMAFLAMSVLVAVGSLFFLSGFMRWGGAIVGFFIFLPTMVILICAIAGMFTIQVTRSICHETPLAINFFKGFLQNDPHLSFWKIINLNFLFFVFFVLFLYIFTGSIYYIFLNPALFLFLYSILFLMPGIALICAGIASEARTPVLDIILKVKSHIGLSFQLSVVSFFIGILPPCLFGIFSVFLPRIVSFTDLSALLIYLGMILLSPFLVLPIIAVGQLYKRI